MSGVEMLHVFIQDNFAALVIIASMFIFLFTNNLFDRGTSNRFKLCMVFVLLLVIFDSLERCQETLPYPTNLHIFCTSMAYTLRTLTTLSIINIVVRGKMKKRLLMCLPAIITLLVSLSAYFTDIAYTFNENNEFVRGPLGFTPHVMSFIYIVLMIVLTAKHFKEKRTYELYMVIGIGVMSVVSVVFEMVFGFYNLLSQTIAVSATFYYMFFLAQSFKRDSLTEALTRRCLYTDIDKYEKYFKSLTVVDFTDLKGVNLREGQDAGDKAIKIFADLIRESMPKDCLLYRLGGGEFMVVGRGENYAEVEKGIETLQEKMKEHNYACTAGYAKVNRSEGFYIAASRADAALYKAKKKLRREVDAAEGEE